MILKVPFLNFKFIFIKQPYTSFYHKNAQNNSAAHLVNNTNSEGRSDDPQLINHPHPGKGKGLKALQRLKFSKTGMGIQVKTVNI